jgi:hypothetical protein
MHSILQRGQVYISPVSENLCKIVFVRDGSKTEEYSFETDKGYQYALVVLEALFTQDNELRRQADKKYPYSLGVNVTGIDSCLKGNSLIRICADGHHVYLYIYTFKLPSLQSSRGPYVRCGVGATIDEAAQAALSAPYQPASIFIGELFT